MTATASSDSGEHTSRTAVRAGIALAVLALIVAAAGVWFVLGSHPSDHRFVIPAGSAARIGNGEQIEIIPNELAFNAGDTLTVVNEDDTDHDVGVTSVPAGETVTYMFPSPGVFDGACTVHPRGSLRITVS